MFVLGYNMGDIIKMLIGAILFSVGITIIFFNRNIALLKKENKRLSLENERLLEEHAKVRDELLQLKENLVIEKNEEVEG